MSLITGGEGLDKHLLVHRIARGEFADQYPAATARLTIHLGNITKEADRWMWHSYQEFFDDLEEVEDLKLVGPSATDSLAYRAGKQITLLGIAVFLLDYYSYEESENLVCLRTAGGAGPGSRRQ